MRHLRVLCFFLLASSVLAFGQNTRSLEAQQQKKTPFFVERIGICCPRRVQHGTVRSFIISRTGAPYSEEAVQRDVQALRDSGFFFDVRANIQDSPGNQNGKIIAVETPNRSVPFAVSSGPNNLQEGVISTSP